MHYARAWQQLRGSNGDPPYPAAAASSAEGSPGRLEAAAEAATLPADAADTLPSEEAAIRVLGVGRDPVSLAVARHRLAGLRDPQRRAQREKEFVDLFLSGGWETVAAQIGMSDVELMRFLEARAQRLVQRNERLLECQLDAGCDIDALRTSSNGAGRRDEEDLLGPDRYARFKAFQQSSREHQFARQLNAHLPASDSLSAADTRRLALALADERESFLAQAQQDGQRGIAHVFASSLVLVGAAPEGTATEYTRLRESATEYGRRLAGRAATVLTPAQFKQFRETLDADMTALQSRLRGEEIEDALRRQARGAP